jgi:ATP-dependent DNA helicase RecG
MAAAASPDSFLDPALAPLRFAARRDFANLDVVRNLEASVRAALARVGPGATPEQRSALARFEAALVGLDALPPGEKRARIGALIALAEGEAGAPAPEALPPRVAPPAPETPPPPKPARRPRGEGQRVRRAAPQVEEEAPATARRVAPEAASLGTPVARLAAVRAKTAERLAARGIRTVRDLLFLLPREYQDRTRAKPIAELEVGQSATIEGEVLISGARIIGRGRRLFEAALSDGTGRISIKYFRFRKQHLEALYARGARLRVTGKVGKFGAQKQMVQPEAHPAEAEPRLSGWVPIYPSIEGVTPAALRGLVQKVANACAHRIVDPVPEVVLTRHGYPPLAQAVARAHHPRDGEERELLEQMRARLVFDELLYGQLALARISRHRAGQPGLAHPGATDVAPLAARLFPFTLTAAQARVAEEIARDLERDRPMHRLLQGDVGSGKTAIALLAAALVHRAGRQTAILAPTEILAEQHAANARRMLEPHGLRTALLTGSTSKKARQQLLRLLAQGQVDVLIGTHALLEADVRFADLGLAITDEQHRFGVNQRQRLLEKREDATPDVLVMTATPIPRTLAMTSYGDLETSIIDELPPGRSPTETRVFVGPQAARAYDAVRAELDAGRQAYIIFPLVETSDVLDLQAATDAVDRIAERFAPHRVGLLHGRLKPDDKSEVMRAFGDNAIQVLVSTTVVEVGVDVPNATCIVIEDAERFGLSQLHQLRGRVGRGGHAGRCFLVTQTPGVSRLEVLEETASGFEVAERDLQIRGPGEILGTAQSGAFFELADPVADRPVLERARAEAARLLAEDPELERHPELRAELTRRFADRMKLAGVG